MAALDGTNKLEALKVGLDLSTYEAASSSRRRVPEWLSTTISLLGFYAVIRLVLLLADVVAAHISTAGQLTGPIGFWDSHFYLEIAAHGYPHALAVSSGGLLTYSAAAFEPIFPAAIWLLRPFVGSYFSAGTLASVTGGAITTIVMWRFARCLFVAQNKNHDPLCVELGSAASKQATWTSAILVAAFPGMAIAWGLLYSESVGLALAAGCLLLLVKKRYAYAGFIGAIATATSPVAMMLVLACLAPAFEGLRRRKLSGAWIAVLLVPLGFVAFVVYVGARYGSALTWFRLEHQAWGASFDFGRGLGGGLLHVWRISALGPGWLEWGGCMAALVGLGAVISARMPGSVVAYCVGVTVLLATNPTLGFKPRFLCWLFPEIIALSSLMTRRGRFVCLAIFVGLLPIAFIAYTSLGNSLAQP